MTSKQPWDYHEDLTRDHLQLVAKILCDTRNNALSDHNPAAGDRAWGLGCKIYERSAQMISIAAGDLFPWLRVISPPLEFVFAIGAVPVRFFRGDANSPLGDHLKVPICEQMQLGLIFNDSIIDLVWRMVVETNPADEAVRVVLLGVMSDGSVKCRYEIPPLGGSVAFITSPRVGGSPPVALPPPQVRPRRQPPKERKDDDDGNAPV